MTDLSMILLSVAMIMLFVVPFVLIGTVKDGKNSRRKSAKK